MKHEVISSCPYLAKVAGIILAVGLVSAVFYSGCASSADVPTDDGASIAAQADANAVDTMPAPSESPYLQAVREFADNVLAYGRDTYGPIHTPLFVDGLMVYDPSDPNYGEDGVFKPVTWISPVGDLSETLETEEWVLSNFASQQTLLRTLDGLSALTGDPTYREAAMEATKYALDNLRAPNGLLYWGQVAAYDTLRDEVWRGRETHTLKVFYPYYELMWQVNPEETKRFIEAYWSAHVIDWSNLDFNRMAGHIDALTNISEAPWEHEYTGGPAFFTSRVSGAGGFFHTGTSLAHAATTLYQLSDQEEPLVWSKRLMQRFVDGRHPNTGISPHIYNQPQKSFVGGGLEEHFSDPRVGVFPFKSFVFPFTEVRELTYLEDVKPHQWLSVLLMGEALGEQGKEFTQWSLEELTAWGKASYRAEDNVFMPILTDGTPIEGTVLEETGNGAPKGSIATPLFADAGYLWLYATAYKTTGDVFMWQMVRNITQGNDFGDIGETSEQEPALNRDTSNADAYSLLGFLELYNKTQNQEFLAIAQCIANNIVATKFHNGFFVPNNEHIYTRFDCFEPLALLRLIATFESQQEMVPQVWPSSPVFAPSYRYKEEGSDRRDIYTLTAAVEPPFSLQEAAAIGDVGLVKALIENGAYIDSVKDGTFKTAFHRAVSSGHKDIVEILLAAGADVNRKDGDGRTPLSYAVQDDNIDLAKLLLSAGADANISISSVIDEQPLLFYALSRGNTELVKLLVEHGARLDSKDSAGMTPIQVAASQGSREMVEVFLSHGIDVSTLHMAACAGDLTSVQSLLDQGADINATDAIGWTPLCWASCVGQAEVVELLVDQGADVTITTSDQTTALHQAAQAGESEVVQILIAHGADVNAQATRGRRPLHDAINAGHKDIVELLINNGAEVNAANAGRPATSYLIRAIMGGDAEIVKLLVDNGARLDVRVLGRTTPIEFAASYGSREIVEVLLSYGIDASTLPMAACAGDLTSVQSLLDQGADINATDAIGWTPLYWAIFMGNTDMVELVINNGAEVNMEDPQGQTPFDLAQQTGNEEIVELLTKASESSRAQEDAE